MALLFDLDGTLLDTAPDFAHVINSVRASMNMPALDIACIRPAISHGLAALINIGFGIQPEHPTYSEMGQRCIKLYQESLDCYTQPFPGIFELLARLEKANIPWGIVTNKPTFLAHQLLKRFQLFERAGCVVCGDTLSVAKPHPEPLWYACEQLKILPAQCVYVGDAERDIQAGKAAGMLTVCALFGYIASLEEAFSWKADHYVQQVKDIEPYYFEQPWIKSVMSI